MFSLIPEASRSLFVHSLHWYAVVNANIAFWNLQCDRAIQGSLINNKEFLFRLLLAAGGVRVISALRLFLLYWLLIRNYPDALICSLPTIMIATGLNILESMFRITMINYYSNKPQTNGCSIVVNIHSNHAGMDDTFYFSIDRHPKTLVFIFQLISKRKYSIILKLEIM